MGKGRAKRKVKLPEDRRDAGTDAAQRKRELYGTDGCDAIGRAYRAGLLGDDGQRLLQTGRSIHRAYWAAYGQHGLTCALGDKTGAANDDDNSLERERWLNRVIREIDAMGREYRKAFDELCLDFYPDYGPSWLDALLEAMPEWEELKRKAAIAKSEDQKLAAFDALDRMGRTMRPHWSKLAKALEVLDEMSA